MGKWIAGLAAAILLMLGALYGVLHQPDIPRRVLEAKYAAPPSQFVTLSPGTRVHYRERGPRNAPVLLLLHGSNSSLFDWEEWSKRLSGPSQTATNPPLGDSDLKGGSTIILELKTEQKNTDPHKAITEAVARIRASIEGFRVISVDLPGHGLTGAVANGDYSEVGMVEFVRAFAAKLGLKRFAIAGNSMGAGVAARFAEIYPDRVTHLIIVDGYAAGLSPAGDRIPLAFKLARTPVVGDLLMRLTPRDLIEEGLDKAVTRPNTLTNDMIDRYWDFSRMEGSRLATLARFRLPPDSYVRDHVKQIKAPVLILWGADDRLLPLTAAKAWAKAIPAAKLIVYPQTGHMPMLERSERSAQDVRDFLRLHDARITTAE
jgi:pimeloyl-ACP methyl ester carboxylesterase